MAIKGTLEGVSQLAFGVWEGDMRWSEIQQLGTPLQLMGSPTVVMVNGAEFDAEANELRFPLDQVSVLNAGSGDRTILVSANGDLEARNEVPVQRKTISEREVVADELPKYGTGDHAFVAALGAMPDHVMRAGEEILERVRKRFPGDLKPYPRRRFFNKPDNFWGVEIQTRLQMLKITIRATPKRFGSSSLKVWLDRPPVYSAFKVQGLDDVDEAVRIISQADRKEG